MLERDIEDAVCKYARKYLFLAEKFTSPNRRSVPDRMFSGPAGLHFFIEFKAPGKTPTPKQARDHARRAALGHRVYVCDDVEDGKRIINFEITGDPAWLSAESSRLLPPPPPVNAMAGHGIRQNGGESDSDS